MSARESQDQREMALTSSDWVGEAEAALATRERQKAAMDGITAYCGTDSRAEVPNKSYCLVAAGFPARKAHATRQPRHSRKM